MRTYKFRLVKNSQQKARHNQAGLSLLEMIVVITICALLATIALPQWHETKLRNELIMTTQQLAYFLNQAQVDAYLYNRTYHLYFFANLGCLTITEGDRPSSCNGRFQFMLPDKSITIFGLTDKKIVSFWGKNNLSQTASLQIQNSIGMTKILISLRGRIRICSQNIALTGIQPC